MVELKRAWLTNKYTKVFCDNEENRKFNAPHHFMVTSVDGKVLGKIDFQEGPIKECGVNGVCNEDVITMVIERLECFQNSEYKCRENDEAITSLKIALHWLRERTKRREAEGKEGTHQV